jgi:hypothetical protein
MKENTLAMALADTIEAPTIGNANLIGDLVKRMKFLEAEKERLEDLLASTSKELEKVSTQDLPKAMADANCASFTTDDGFIIKVQTMYVANVNKGDQREVFDWLDENNFGGMIESNVKIALGKGNRAEALETAELLKNDGYAADLEENVHWATLRAFVREQVEAGAELHPKIKYHQLEKASIKRK